MSFTRSNLYKIFYLLGVRSDILARDFPDEDRAARDAKFFEDLEYAKMVRASCRVYFTVLRYCDIYSQSSDLLATAKGRFNEYSDCIIDIPAMFKQSKSIPDFLNLLTYYIRTYLSVAAESMKISDFSSIQWFFFHFDGITESNLFLIRDRMLNSEAPYGLYFAHNDRFGNPIVRMLQSDAEMYATVYEIIGRQATIPDDLGFDPGRPTERGQGAQFYGRFPEEVFSSKCCTVIVDGTDFNVGVLFKVLALLGANDIIEIYTDAQHSHVLALDWHNQLNVIQCPVGEVHSCIVHAIACCGSENIFVLSNSYALYQYNRIADEFTQVIALPVCKQLYHDLEKEPSTTIALLAKVGKSCMADLPDEYYYTLEDCCETLSLDCDVSASLAEQF